eukprot:6024063-Prymnesium_polylepis.1
MGEVDELFLPSLGWGDEAAGQLARVIEWRMPRLKRLYLFGNKIGDKGAKALEAAILTKRAPLLNELWLEDNPASEECKEALQAALKAIRTSTDGRDVTQGT